MAKQTDQIKGFRLSPKHNERLMRLSELTDLTQTQLVRTLIPPSDKWLGLVADEVARTRSDNIFDSLKELLAAGLRLRMETAGVAAFGASMLWQLEPDGLLDAYEGFITALRGGGEYRIETLPNRGVWQKEGLAGRKIVLWRREALTDRGVEIAMEDEK